MSQKEFSMKEFSLANIALITVLNDKECGLQVTGNGNDLFKKSITSDQMIKMYVSLMDYPVAFWDEVLPKSYIKSFEKSGIYHGLTVTKHCDNKKTLFFSFGFEKNVSEPMTLYLNLIKDMHKYLTKEEIKYSIELLENMFREEMEGKAIVH